VKVLIISGDLPMSKVKFGARAEYEYLDNFKILQASFKRHQIDKVSILTFLRSFPFLGTWNVDYRIPDV